MKPAVDQLSQFIFDCDNLQDQTTKVFVWNKSKEWNSMVGVTDATDIWQPVDNGYGALYKRLIS